VIFGVAVVVVLPSIGLLFTLAQRSVVEEISQPLSHPEGGTGATSKIG
jgi:hypothetical protein